MIGGCAVLFGAAVNEVDKAIDEELENDKPATVAAGDAFARDGFEVADGWKVAPEQFGGITVKNPVAAEIECTSNEMQEGESSQMDCFSMGSESDVTYDTIKVSDMW